MIVGLLRRRVLSGAPRYEGAQHGNKTFETLTAKLCFGLDGCRRVNGAWTAEGSRAERRRKIRIVQLCWWWCGGTCRFSVLLARNSGLSATAEFRDDVNQAVKGAKINHLVIQ